jgi:hypothetical protein
MASCSQAAYLAAECHVSLPAAVYVCPGDSLNIPLGGNTESRGTEETLVQEVCATVIASRTSLENLILNVVTIIFNISLQFPFGPDRFDV